MGSWPWLFSSKMEDSRPCLEGCRSPLFQGSVALETCESSGIGRGAGFWCCVFWWFLMFFLMVLMVCFFVMVFHVFFWWFLEKVFDLFDGWSQLSRWSTEISPTKEHHEVHGSNLRQKFSWFDHIPPGKWLQVGWDLARTWHLSGRSPFSPAVAVDGYRSPSRNGRFQLSSPPLHC